jgi:hypothetical protein
MTAMKIGETDEWADEDDVAVYRERARTMLDQIVREVKLALKEADIDLDVFLMIPNSGDAIATFGTITDPPDDLWRRTSDIVCSIVREMAGLDGVRSRALSCASTADQSGDLDSPADTGGPVPIPAPMPSLDAGAER